MDKVEDKIKVQRNGLDFNEEVQRNGSKESETVKFRGLDNSKISESDLALWEQSPPIADIPSRSDNYQSDSDGKSCSSKLSHCASVTAVVITLIFIWCLFVIPQLCYFHLGICTQQSNMDNEIQSVTQIQNCSNYTYTGTQCINMFGSCSNPLVNMVASSSMETDLQTLFFILDSQKLSSSCEPEKQSIKEFVCLYSYQPCDIDNGGILPSRNVCEYYRDTACSTEWSLLLNGQYGSLLPNCGELPVAVATDYNCSIDDTTTVVIPPPSDNNDTDVSNNNTNNIMDTPQGTCGNVSYSGESCTKYLSPCSVNEYLSSTETSVTLLFSLFTQASDQSCKDSQLIIEEFLCQFVFPRCDSNLTTHYPNRSVCENIRDNLCPNDWSTIKLLAGALLPDCSMLPNTSIDPVCIDIQPPTDPPVTQSTDNSTMSISLQCNEKEGFYLYIANDEDNETSINNTCQAHCSEWIQFGSKPLAIFDDVFVLLSTSIGLIAAIIVVILSIIRRERMLVFPSIFLVYGILHTIVFAIVILIQYTDRKALSCSSDDLVVTSTENPTFFCQFSGFVFLHSVIGITYWWFVHVVAIFWKIMFPFHAKIHEDKGKWIHIIAIIFGIIIPVIPPSLAFVYKGYTVVRFPVLLCYSVDSNVTYYGVLLPLSLFVTIGISMLVFVLQAIHAKSRLFRYRVSQTHMFGLSTAEKKLLLVFVYYILIGYLDVISFTITTASIDELTRYTREYLLCEALRVNPDYICPRQYEEIRTSFAFSLVTYVLLGLYPVLNLVFAVNKSELQAKVVKTFPSIFTESFRDSSIRSSTMNAPDTPFTLKRRLTYNISTADEHPMNSRTHDMATIGKSGFYLKRETSESV